MEGSGSPPDLAFISCPSSPALPPLGADVPILFFTLPDTPSPDRSAPAETVHGKPSSPSSPYPNPNPNPSAASPTLASLSSRGGKKMPWYVKKRSQKPSGALQITAQDSPTPETGTLQPCLGLSPHPRASSTSPAGTPTAAENASHRKKKYKASKNKSTAQQIPPKPPSSHQAQEATTMVNWITINSACRGDNTAAVVAPTPQVDVRTMKREVKKSRTLKITSEDSPPETTEEVEGLTVNSSGPRSTAPPNLPVAAEISVPGLEPQCPQNLEDVVNLFSRMKPNKVVGDMDILDVCAMKGIHFPQPSWWRPGGYDD